MFNEVVLVLFSGLKMEKGRHHLQTGFGRSNSPPGIAVKLRMREPMEYTMERYQMVRNLPANGVWSIHNREEEIKWRQNQGIQDRKIHEQRGRDEILPR